MARDSSSLHIGASGCGSSSTAAMGAATTACVTKPKPRTDPAWLALRLPKVAHGPVPGYVLIADRNNNRVLLVSPGKKIVWRFDALRGPDDAFFTPGWRSVITNEEFNDTLRQVSLRARRIVWSYGHAGVPVRAPAISTRPATRIACRTATRPSPTSATAASSS